MGQPAECKLDAECSTQGSTRIRTPAHVHLRSIAYLPANSKSLRAPSKRPKKGSFLQLLGFCIYSFAHPPPPGSCLEEMPDLTCFVLSLFPCVGGWHLPRVRLLRRAPGLGHGRPFAFDGLGPCPVIEQLDQPLQWSWPTRVLFCGYPCHLVLRAHQHENHYFGVPR